MIGIGVVGYGYWGPNLVRNFQEVNGARVVGVCDLRPERLDEVRRRYPGALATDSARELIGHPDVDAVAIATPVSTHYPLALAALRAGKHVLVEKPLASSAEQASRLIDEADRRKRVLLVDHTFLYTGAVRKIRELIEQGELGEIYYYDSVRVNLGLFQHDVNVVWDLAVHDLAIMDHLLGAEPCSVSATAVSHVASRPENIAYLTLRFPSNQIAHIHVNWLAPVKIRRTLIGGSRKMVVYDDLEPSEKVKVYDKGLTFRPGREAVNELPFTYRTGDVWVPHLDPTEALRREAEFFVDCVQNGRQPHDEVLSGLRVVRILEAATRSMARSGAAVEVGRRLRAA
jgi:predicted dehydrogenase